MADTTSGPTDAECVARARQGDADAYELLVRRHYRSAYAVALAVTGAPMDAEDICHDGFLRALERLEECRSPDRFGAWLGQIVRNRALNLLRERRRRDGPTLEDTELRANSNTSLRLERGELRQQLEEALQSLDQLRREVVLLHDLEGWKHEAIAQHLGCSVGMSRLHLFHARRALRARLGRQLLTEYTHDR